jgi:hypothetical protein
MRSHQIENMYIHIIKGSSKNVTNENQSFHSTRTGTSFADPFVYTFIKANTLKSSYEACPMNA